MTRSSLWIHEPAHPDAAAGLARDAAIPGWIAAMLVRRGIVDKPQLDAWMNPRLASLQDPFLLPDMEPAVDRLLKAIARGERVTIFGDYDVDGLCSTSLMADVLGRTGVPVDVFLPHRLEEGYGLSEEALQRCLEETSPSLIVTVDCGTGSIAAVDAARRAGVDVIITDHHAVGENLAPAVAVVNPRRSTDASCHVLAGVGVAFKVAHALIKKARRLAPVPGWAEFDPRELLDLVALGTIADLVPLTGENRILVAHGLKRLDSTKRTGLKELIDVADIDRTIGVYEVGFLLGPRLNAAGRLASAKVSLELLMTDSLAVAASHARQLDAANRERRAVEKDVVDQLLARVEARAGDDDFHAIVESDPSWHPGVVGLAATRATQRHCCPSVVIGADDRDRAKGSCRSVAGFNMVEALDACSDLLIKHGGHAMAAGLEIAWDQIDAFRRKFNEVAARQIGNRPRVPQWQIDGWIEPSDITLDSIELLNALGPYGMGFPEPLWASRDLQWEGEPREVGTGHLKGHLGKRGHVHEIIGFGLFQPPLPAAPLETAFQIRKDAFRGRERIVLHLKDIRAQQ